MEPIYPGIKVTRAATPGRDHLARSGREKPGENCPGVRAPMLRRKCPGAETPHHHAWTQREWEEAMAQVSWRRRWVTNLGCRPRLVT